MTPMENTDAFKTCPFCREQIREAAVKCRYCGEWMQKPPQITNSALEESCPTSAFETPAPLSSASVLNHNTTTPDVDPLCQGVATRMNTAEFLADLVTRFQRRGYSFLLPDQPFEPKQMSEAARSTINTVSAAAVGFIVGGPVGSVVLGLCGRQGAINNGQMVADLNRIKEHCNLVGVDLRAGTFTQVLLALNADALTDEAIVKRCQLIHNQLIDFVNNSFPKSITGRPPVFASLFVAFSSSKRTKEFIEGQSPRRCRQSRKGATITPIVKDLETGSLFHASGKQVVARSKASFLSRVIGVRL